MADDYVTRAELNTAIIGLEQRMDKGFAELKEQITALAHTLENNQHKDKEVNDERYLLREEARQEAAIRLNDPLFRQLCFPVVADYLDSADGKLKLGCLVDQHFANKRDSATKWINFIKLIAGIIIVIIVAYGGYNVDQSNKQTQKAVIETLQRIQK